MWICHCKCNSTRAKLKSKVHPFSTSTHSTHDMLRGSCYQFADLGKIAGLVSDVHIYNYKESAMGDRTQYLRIAGLASSPLHPLAESTHDYRYTLFTLLIDQAESCPLLWDLSLSTCVRSILS